MPKLNRIRSILRYLGKADSFYKWKVFISKCPSCNGRVFLSLRRDAFMTRCLFCFANVTNLSLIPVIQMHSKARRIEVAWEMSTYGATLAYLKRNVPQVYESEYFPDAILGSSVDGILNQDVQDLTFEDSTLDIITSNQVFEHVQDDLLGFRECCRVLKPGGALIFSIPLYDVEATKQLALVFDGKVEHLDSPEYHDSRRDGPSSVLCFWRHSFHDIAERVSSAGFNARLVEIRLPESLREPTFVIYALKE